MMQDFQQRVVDEKAELDGKLARLNAFMETAVYLALPWDERCRLSLQVAVMGAYSDVLGERVAAFDLLPTTGCAP